MAVDRIPVDPQWRIWVVVKDARAAARDYAEVYGIEQWALVDHSMDRLTSTSKDGRPVKGSFLMAVGETPAIRFNLIQPTGGETAFSEFLCTHGEGIQGIQTAVLDRTRFAELRAFMETQGIPIGQAGTLDGAVSFYAFDTRKDLGGFQVAVLVPETDDWLSRIKVDEQLDFSRQHLRPQGQPPLPTRGCSHFGVVVYNLMERLERYVQLFKVPVWRGNNWHTAPGSLEDPTYLGKPVDHAYFTGMGAVGDTGLAFEVIQPTFGPSHYKEDFRNIVGEGIHHMNLVPLKAHDEYVALERWLRSMGVEMCMSGGLRHGLADFWYFDTRRKLHGYVTEVTCPRPTQGEPRRFTSDFTFDFSSRIGAAVEAAAT